MTWWRLGLLGILTLNSGCALGLSRDELREECGPECQSGSCGAGEYLDIEKKCQALSRCQEDEFEVRPPTATSDRECKEARTCLPGTFVVAEPESGRDRICAPCPVDTFSSTKNAPSCSAVRTCDEGEAIVGEAKASKDASCAPCGPEEFEKSGVCMPITECGPDEFEFAPPTTTTDRACRPLTDCPPGTAIEFTHTKTRDRYCSPCEANTFSSTKNALQCTPWANCNSDALQGPLELETTAPTKESDRECAVSYCGDGIVDRRIEEACDDANDDDFDICTNKCQWFIASDGQTCTTDEECLDGTCIAYYSDEDGDSFHGTRVSSDYCSSHPPDGYSPINTDCCDADPFARPNQSDYFALPNACGDFDYNCDEEESPGFVALNECLSLGETALSFRGWLDELPGCGAEGEYAPAQTFNLVCEPEAQPQTQVCR